MDPQSSSPPLALISLPSFPDGWRPILEASNQVVLYNPSSHALSVTNSGHQGLSPSKSDEDGRSVNCPYCHRPLSEEPPLMFDRNHQQTRATNYFHLLAAANEISRPTTPITPSGEGRPLGSDVMAEGYFEAFFKEEKRLGMGANGSVWLCEHVLDGNHLGHYAVKKVAVGQSHAYLLNILREVRLLETLRHPNIITYHHSWLESFRFSPFGELVPTLFILMQWAEGGSLDDYIASRQGMTSGTVAPNDPKAEPSAEDFISRSDRIRAFREQKKARAESPEAKRSKPRETKAVHLLNADELRSLFQDVVTGLAFLHDRSILHLDLKPGNVLLTWDENRLIPRAMLSDFGTSQDSLNTARPRSGNTGTLEYTSPEALDASRSLDTKADMWSLGMILHKLVFFRLPYVNDRLDELENEIRSYPGFTATPEASASFIRRGLPSSILLLLQSLLHIVPTKRPSSERVLNAIISGKYETNGKSSHTGTPPPAMPLVLRTVSNAPIGSPRTEDEQTPTRAISLSRRSSDDLTRTPVATITRPLTPEKTPVLEWSEMEVAASPIAADPTLILGKHRLPRSFVIQAFKSAFLIAKMVHLHHRCALGTPRMPIICLSVALAVVDTWSDSLMLSAALGAGHFALIRSLRGQLGHL